MATVNLGRVGFVPKGEYDSTATYTKLDVVVYRGTAYCALKTLTNVVPADDGVSWRLLVDGVQLDSTLTDSYKAAPADKVGGLSADLVELETATVNKIVSKNKFGSTEIKHETITETGWVNPNASVDTTDYIEIGENDNYYVMCGKSGSNPFMYQGAVVFFDANKTAKVRLFPTAPIEIDSQWKYYRCWFGITINQKYCACFEEEPTTVPTYESYFDPYLLRKPLDSDSVAEAMLTSDVRAKLNSGGSSAEYVPFAGKKIVGVGDSIMVGINSNGNAIVDGKNADGTPCTDQGYQVNSTGGFLGALRTKYPSINVVNMGVGSTTMQRNNSIPVNATYKCIMDRIDDIPSDADIIILEGGVNDYFHSAQYGTTLGTYAEHLYKYPTSAKYENGTYSYVEWAIDVHLDVNAFCGAFEIALTKILVRFIGKPFIYVIPHNPSASADIDAYFDSAKAICKKYGVPVVDIRENGCMPRIYAIQGKTDGSSAFTYDGVHPNPLGYQKHYVPQIASMLKSIM